jgi:geranylgeranyl reductase family protein
VERFDGIVVGAGPAGSTTAYRLASAGARVLLLDRARFPRDKPCGGGLTLRAVRQMAVDPAPVVEDRVDRMQLSLRYGRSFERHSDEPLILMTQRRRLDHFLAEQAAGAGADFRDGTKVTAIVQDDDGVTVTAGTMRAHAPVVIGADGANGIVARALGLDTGYTHGVSFEGNVRYGDVDAAAFRGKAVIELGSVPGGYGWVFPKGDHANFGVGGWESEGPRLRAHLDRLCVAHGVDPETVEELRGYRLPLRPADAQSSRGRVLLVGDAAGLVDPLSGDGMYECFISARLAADAVLSGDLASYATALARSLNAMTSASWGAKLALERFPRTTFGIARLPLAWRVVEKLLSGELEHPGRARGLARAPMRFLDGLARAAGDPGRGYRLAA